MRLARAGAALGLLVPWLLAASPGEPPAPAPPPPVAEPAPAGPPEDVPRYAGAVTISSMASPERGTILDLRSGDAPEQVFGWYRDEFARRGWLIEKQSGAAGQHLVTAFKDRRKATLLISPAPGTNPAETRILLTVSEALRE